MNEGFSGKRVLITGGLGFIGSNLAHRLVGLGAEVAIADSLRKGCGGNRYNAEGINFDVEEISVRDRGYDYVFSMAGRVSHIDSMTGPFWDLYDNCEPSLELLESCRKYDPSVRIIYTSTRQIYGKPDYLPVDEEHPLRPVDINGIHKLAAEQYHTLYHNVYGLDTISLRLTNTYGPRMHIKDARLGFLGWFIRQAMEGKTIQLYGDGQQARDINYVDDVVDALLLAALSDEHGVFNLGGEPYTLMLLCDWITEMAGMDSSYDTVPWPDDRKRIDIGSYYGDYTKAEMLLGWSPKVTLRDGLERTVAWYREHWDSYV